MLGLASTFIHVDVSVVCCIIKYSKKMRPINMKMKKMKQQNINARVIVVYAILEVVCACFVFEIVFALKGCTCKIGTQFS